MNHSGNPRLKIKNYRRISHAIIFIEHSRVDERCCGANNLPIPFMDVSTDVNLRLYFVNGVEQVGTTYTFTLAGFVKSAKDRSVRYQKIGVRRNELPMTRNRISAMSVESPVKEPRRNGRTPYFYAFNGHSAVLQIRNIRGNDFFNDLVWRSLKKEVVITRRE